MDFEKTPIFESSLLVMMNLLMWLSFTFDIPLSCIFWYFTYVIIYVLYQIKIRGFLSHIRQICIGYWGIYAGKSQSVSSFGLPSPRPQDAGDSTEQSSEASGDGRSWVQSMFSRDKASSFSRVRKWTSDGGNSGTFLFCRM